MKKYIKKVTCLLIMGIFVAGAVANAATVADSFTFSETISGATYTASGYSKDNPSINERKASTSCSYGSSASVSATYAYFNYDTDSVVKVTGGSSGQYGGTKTFSRPTGCSFLDLYVSATHNYRIGSSNHTNNTKDLSAEDYED